MQMSGLRGHERCGKGHRRAAVGREVTGIPEDAPAGERRVAGLSIELGVGADGERVPRLSRILDRREIARGQVVDFEVVNVSGRDDEQS